MLSPVKSKAISWNNLPSEEALQQMSSALLLALARTLGEAKPSPVPEAAIEWVMSNAPERNRKKAREALADVLWSARHVYTQNLMDLAQQAFKKEPVTAENEKLFEELMRRQVRLQLSMNLGLCTQQETDWILARQKEWGERSGAIFVDNNYFQSTKNQPHMVEHLSERLALWKGMLEEIDDGLPILDKEIVRARLDEELKKPFAPTKKHIERTRHELSSHDNDVGTPYALSFLKKQHQASMDLLIAWLDDLGGQAAPELRRPKV